MSQLAEALRVDLHWIREHTRLGELATRWEGRGRPESLLLRGDDLDTAKAWLAARKAAAPEITDAQYHTMPIRPCMRERRQAPI